MQVPQKALQPGKKIRLKSLDGLRGLAALGVFLSHTDFNVAAVTHAPLAAVIFQIFSAGSNSVQILFVLSGFLMSSLYPKVPNLIAFWQKRYTRIFPIFGVVVLFLWLTDTLGWGENWWQKLLLLFSLAVLAQNLWLLFRHFNQGKKKFDTKLFAFFISLQMLLLSINLLLTPHFVQFHQLVLPATPQSIFILFSNLTLTTPFADGLPLLSGVFWSLAPEVLFYLLYPLIVIPLVQLGQKHGFLLSFFLVVGVTKILFDLQPVFWSMAGLQSLSIGRATGFMVGVILGSVAQSKNQVWLQLKKISAVPAAGIIFLCIFAVTQWLNASTQWATQQQTLGWFYFISSWSIGGLLITAIQPNTLTNRLFSNKLLTFLGTISYSFYLIHRQVIWWGLDIMKVFGPRTTLNGWYEVTAVIVELVLSILVSWFLFHTVERLYFLARKEKSATVPALTSPHAPAPVALYSATFLKPAFRPQLQLFLLSVAVILTTSFFFFVYAGGYSPSILVTHFSLPSAPQSSPASTISLLHQPLRFVISAQYPNLSVVALSLEYAGDAEKTRNQNLQPANLIFRLYDTSGHQLFESQRHAYEVAGEDQFPFGFPPLPSSANQQYVAELIQEQGGQGDQIQINRSTANPVNEYTQTAGRSPQFFFQLLFNRLQFTITSTQFLFAVAFSVLVVILINKQKIALLELPTRGN